MAPRGFSLRGDVLSYSVSSARVSRRIESVEFPFATDNYMLVREAASKKG